MKIYVDFDDVICETARYFTRLASDLFGIDVPYEKVRFFDLQRSFDLTALQYAELMRIGHEPDNLLSYEETPGASEKIGQWLSAGHEVCVITGRPAESFSPSRAWLDAHRLEHIPLFCVDKYGRSGIHQNCSYSLPLDAFYRMDFDFAVEDSPSAFEHLLHFDTCRVAVFDRPWNHRSELPDDRFVRCSGWNEVGQLSENFIAAEQSVCPRRSSL